MPAQSHIHKHTEELYGEKSPKGIEYCGKPAPAQTDSALHQNSDITERSLKFHFHIFS